MTYFGFDPDCTKEEVRERLLQYKTGDNRITELSRLTALNLVPAGIRLRELYMRLALT